MMTMCQGISNDIFKSKNEVSHYYKFEMNLFWLKTAFLEPIILWKKWLEDTVSYICFSSLSEN